MMLSLANAMDAEEMVEFDRRIKRLLKGDADIEYVAEVKLDGLAVELVYERPAGGRLDARRRRQRRGRHAEYPHDQEHTAAPDASRRRSRDAAAARGARRGDLCRAGPSSGSTPSASRLASRLSRIRATPRPARCASSTRASPPSRPLDIFCHSPGVIEGISVQEPVGIPAGHQSVRPQDQSAIARCCNGVEEVLDYWNEMTERAPRTRLRGGRRGRQGQFVRAAGISSARFRARRDGRSRTSSRRSRLRPGFARSAVQVGRIGSLTPVAKLEPVALAGVTISNASLHNLDEIRRKDVREGDTVLIERAGDVIPYVVRVTHRADPRAAGVPDAAHCPECGGAIVHEEGEVGYFCVNVNCPARMRESIRHFASKNCLDIDGLGDKLVAQLVESGLVKELDDLYRSQRAQLVGARADGRQERAECRSTRSSARAIPRSIALINGLGIRHVGEHTARQLALRFRTLDALMAARARMNCARCAISGPKSRAVSANTSPSRAIARRSSG